MTAMVMLQCCDFNNSMQCLGSWGLSGKINNFESSSIILHDFEVIHKINIIVFITPHNIGVIE